MASQKAAIIDEIGSLADSIASIASMAQSQHDVSTYLNNIVNSFKLKK